MRVHYLRQALAFNAQKFRWSRDPGHVPFWEIFKGMSGLSLEHVCQI